MTFKYGIDKLTVNKVIRILNGSLKADITSEAKQKVNDCRLKVETMACGNKAVYGINTGFGPLCDVQITPEQTNKLQENASNSVLIILYSYARFGDKVKILDFIGRSHK